MLKSSKNTKDDPCPAFLKKLADLSGAGRIDAGVDEVIDYFESLFAKGDWYSSNKTLAHAEVSGLDTAVSLAMLSMTLVEKRRLSARKGFFSRLRRDLVASRGRQTAEELLSGFE